MTFTTVYRYSRDSGLIQRELETAKVDHLEKEKALRNNL